MTVGENGAKISANPINFEIERAKATRKLFRWAANLIGDTLFNTNSWMFGGGSSAMKDYQDLLRKDGFKSWRSWNSPVGNREMFDYENENAVLYRDKFGKFYEKFKKGEISDKENTIEKAGNIDKTNWGKIGMGAIRVLIPGTIAVEMATDAVVKKVGDIKREFSYDKRDPNEGKEKIEKEDGWLKSGWKRAKNFWNSAKRKKQVHSRMGKLKDIEAFGLKYGDVREWMIHGGVIELFKRSQIANPVGSAIPFLKWLLDKGNIIKAPKVKDATPIHDLVHNFFAFA